MSTEELEGNLEDIGFDVENRSKDGDKARLEISKNGLEARLTHFQGGRNIKPWIEAELLFEVDPTDAEVQNLFQVFAEVLDPGSHVMVTYDNDLTARALNIGVPAPATPVGYLMWKAGFRWYKDWYISEGWKEGGQKLQANLPLDEEIREEREEEAREDLEEFLEGEVEHEECRELGAAVLESIKS